jgi:hypothetical protein
MVWGGSIICLCQHVHTYACALSTLAPACTQTGAQLSARRVFLALHHILKELASKRLAGDQVREGSVHGAHRLPLHATRCAALRGHTRTITHVQESMTMLFQGSIYVHETKKPHARASPHTHTHTHTHIPTYAAQL